MFKWSKIRNSLLPATRAQINETRQMVAALAKKMSMPDGVWQNNDVRFYVPNYPLDLIQRIIVDSENFFEQNILNELSSFMPQEAVICDIGANIGNHTLYWLSKKQASYIYCFEPRPETFQILKKNIQINNFEDKSECFNCGLSDKESTLKIEKFSSKNIGGATFVKNSDGRVKAVSLDSLNLPRKIDFIKIDVEEMEDDVLRGAVNTLAQHKPTVFIEILPHNFLKIKNLLESLGYFLKLSFAVDNFLFMPIKK